MNLSKWLSVLMCVLFTPVFVVAGALALPAVAISVWVRGNDNEFFDICMEDFYDIFNSWIEWVFVGKAKP